MPWNQKFASTSFLVVMLFISSCATTDSESVRLHKRVSLNGDEFYAEFVLNPTSSGEGWLVPGTLPDAYAELDRMLPRKIADALTSAAVRLPMSQYPTKANPNSFRHAFSQQFAGLAAGFVPENQMLLSDLSQGISEMWPDLSNAMIAPGNRSVKVGGNEDMVKLLIELYAAHRAHAVRLENAILESRE